MYPELESQAFPYSLKLKNFSRIQTEQSNLIPNENSKPYLTIKLFFKLASALFLIHFKPLVTADGTILMKSTWFRKIINGLFAISALVLQTFMLWKAFSSGPLSIQKNPGQLYNIGTSIILTIGGLIFVKMSWGKNPALLKFYRSCYEFSLIRNATYQNQKSSRNPYVFSKDAWFFYGLGFACVGEPTISLVLDVMSISDAINGNDEAYVLKNLSIFGLNECFKTKGYTYRWIFLLIGAILYFHSKMFFHASVLTLPYTTCGIVYQVSQDFVEYFQTGTESSYDENIKFYLKVKRMLSEVNEATGLLILAYIGSGLISFTNWLTICNHPAYGIGGFSIFASSLVIAAEANRKFQCFGTFIFENQHRSDFYDSSILLQDFSLSPLGLKAHTFPITYGFVFTVFGTVLTYLIVLQQFKTSNIL